MDFAVRIFDIEIEQQIYQAKYFPNCRRKQIYKNIDKYIKTKL